MAGISRFVGYACRNVFRYRRLHTFLVLMLGFIFIILFLILSLRAQVHSSWQRYCENLMMGRWNISLYKGLQIDYTHPPVYRPEGRIPDRILSWLDENSVPYAKRIKVGAGIYSRKEQRLHNFLVSLVGMDFRRELPEYRNFSIKASNGRPEPKVIIWETLARELDLNVDEMVTLLVRSRERLIPLLLKIDAIGGPASDAGIEDVGDLNIFPLVFVDYTYLDSLLRLKGDFQELIVFDSPLPAGFFTLTGQYDVTVFRSFQGFNSISGITAFLDLVLAVVVSFLFFVSGVTIMGFQLMNFSDRRKEIGTLYSLGVHTRDVIFILIMERFLVTIAAFASAISVLFLLSVSPFRELDFRAFSPILAGAPFSFEVRLPFVMRSTAVVSVFIALSSAYPLIKSVRVNPAEILRAAE